MTRTQREQQLNELANTKAGCNQILDLYKSLLGIPPGSGPEIGTLVRAEMIPAILQREYPSEVQEN